ncbi:MAG: hypothetical protein GX164_04225 [Clostridiales bacterium]|jgi:protein arginine kinase activator|nr:hypothetical protein [Clostridiales bacterium]
MLCNRCEKNEAVVFYNENINGYKKSYSLCNDCARELEAAGEINLNFVSPFEEGESLLSSLFESVFGVPSAPALSGTRRSAKEKRCPLCGISIRELSEEGKVGCTECYRSFADELRPSITRIHGSVRHKGRFPLRFKNKCEKENVLDDLRRRLKEAIKNEEFERAAALRDEISNLTAEA